MDPAKCVMDRRIIWLPVSVYIQAVPCSPVIYIIEELTLSNFSTIGLRRMNSHSVHINLSGFIVSICMTGEQGTARNT